MSKNTNRAGVSATLVGCVVALFFAWGFSTVLVDTLLPKLKGLFQLNYTEATLTQFAFFMAYFVVSFPAALAVGTSRLYARHRDRPGR